METLLRPEDLVVRYSVYIEYRGRTVIDDSIARLLEAVRETGSIYRASRALGIPYSRAWEAIARVERALGERVVESYRGGRRRGETRLTETGLRLLEIYHEARRGLERYAGLTVVSRVSQRPDIIVAHSDDIVLARALETLRHGGVEVQGLCIGSGLSLAMLSLGRADVACTHLYDPATGDFNKTYLERFWLRDRVVAIGGFYREQVLAFRRGSGLEGLGLEEVLDRALSGELRVGMRNRGSGTRILFEHILRERAVETGRGLEKVSGLWSEYSTHDETAEAVREGRVDIALMPRYVAEKTGLSYIHVLWEKYECFSEKSSIERPGVKRLSELLRPPLLYGLLENTPGYRPL